MRGFGGVMELFYNSVKVVSGSMTICVCQYSEGTLRKGEFCVYNLCLYKSDQKET